MNYRSGVLNILINSKAIIALLIVLLVVLIIPQAVVPWSMLSL